MPDKRKRAAERLPDGARILYEDGEVLVVDKPAGMISARPGDTTGTSLFYHVRHYARRRGGNAWIIHRLDRDVSGLLVFAKTPTAYAALKDQLKRRQVQRGYLAVVEGEVAPAGAGDWQWIDAFIADDGPGKPVRWVGEAPAATARGGPCGRSPAAACWRPGADAACWRSAWRPAAGTRSASTWPARATPSPATASTAGARRPA